MVDLIPVGTVNRQVNENNSSKPAQNVQETTRSKSLADQENPIKVERRRTGNRRRNSSDRRLLTKASRKKVTDRRKNPDRRGSRVVKNEGQNKRAGLMRKGRIIDEHV